MNYNKTVSEKRYVTDTHANCDWRYAAEGMLRRMPPIRRLTVIAVAMAVTAFAAVASASAAVKPDEKFLYTVDGTTITVTPRSGRVGTVTVDNPSATKFSDRPYRYDQPTTLTSLLKSFYWSPSTRRLGKPTPNASVSVAGGRSQVVEIQKASRGSRRLTLVVRSLRGPLEAASGPGAIVIDDVAGGAPPLPSPMIVSDDIDPLPPGRTGWDNMGDWAVNGTLGFLLPAVPNAAGFWILTACANNVNWSQTFDKFTPATTAVHRREGCTEYTSSSGGGETSYYVDYTIRLKWTATTVTIAIDGLWWVPLPLYQACTPLQDPRPITCAYRVSKSITVKLGSYDLV